MSHGIFRLNQKVEIVQDVPLGVGSRHFYSRIEDVGEDTLAIAVPYYQGLYLSPRSGTQFRAIVVTEKGLYSFDTKLLRYEGATVPLWIIPKPAEVKKIQRRSFVRLNTNIYVNIAIPDSDDSPKTSLTKNISGGGLQLLSERPVAVGHVLSLSFPLADFTVEAEGTVVHTIPPDAPNDKYRLGIQFVNIDEKTREAIVKYIFHKEVEQKKKGLAG
jgi:c-di-GMP-binding flagellar brake protein YcgR